MSLLSSGKKMVGWSNSNKQDVFQGFAFFSNVKEAFPKADMKFVFVSFASKLADSLCWSPSYLRELLCFEADKSMNATNLSRADPTLFCLKVPSGPYSSPYICYRGQSVPAHCFIMGMVREDKTRAPYQLSNDKWMKTMTLIPFALEADRMITATAMIFDTEQFKGQLLDGNVMSFSSRQGLIGKNHIDQVSLFWLGAF